MFTPPPARVGCLLACARYGFPALFTPCTRGMFGGTGRGSTCLAWDVWRVQVRSYLYSAFPQLHGMFGGYRFGI